MVPNVSRKSKRQSFLGTLRSSKQYGTFQVFLAILELLLALCLNLRSSDLVVLLMSRSNFF